MVFWESAAAVLFVAFILLHAYYQSKISEMKRTTDNARRKLEAREQALLAREKELEEERRDIPRRIWVGVLEKIESGAKNSFLDMVPLLQNLVTPDKEINPRILSAMRAHMTFTKPPSVQCKIQGEHGNVYDVSLEKCTCPDFINNRARKPCKHMYRLALELGLLASFDDSRISSRIVELDSQINSKLGALNKVQKKLDTVNRLLKEKSQKFPWLSRLYADYIALQEQQVADSLRTKARPALRASDELAKISREKHALQIRCKELEHQLDYLDAMFPWLKEFKERPPAAGIPFDIDKVVPGADIKP